MMKKEIKSNKQKKLLTILCVVPYLMVLGNIIFNKALHNPDSAVNMVLLLLALNAVYIGFYSKEEKKLVMIHKVIIIIGGITVWLWA